MKKNIFFVFGLITVVILTTAGITVSFKVKKLNQQVSSAQALNQKMREEVMRLGAEKEKAIKENEKLQTDTVSYLGINTQLQREKEKLAQGLEEAQKLIEDKVAELKELNDKLIEQEKRIKEQPVVQDKFAKEKNELQNEIKALEGTLQNERALFHYNLGVAYTQAKLYDDALQEYEKSLSINPGNPDVHYNLGLLYENYLQDNENARQHFEKYLELNPAAEDKEEVKGWIAGLSTS